MTVNKAQLVTSSNHTISFPSLTPLFGGGHAMRTVSRGPTTWLAWPLCSYLGSKLRQRERKATRWDRNSEGCGFSAPLEPPLHRMVQSQH
ncbi:hypothetical protein RRG08_052720 [Elysia crispata]|uniref:Uncharacterized protein n=1 Tax=Elysia crispata TaxID=231223 RepID=A0AAE1B5W4_9GAST|nr:hypothetical protein RRG08_052720 [Elysia crispata]